MFALEMDRPRTTSSNHKRRRQLLSRILIFPAAIFVALGFKRGKLERRLENPRVVWPKNAPSHSTNSPRGTGLLIAQYSSAEASPNGTYGKLLHLTSEINQAYAVQWKHDYIVLIGIPFQNETEMIVERHVVDGKRTNINYDESRAVSPNFPNSQATYSKLTLLEMALDDPDFQKYDRLLLLDADAMMYDFSRDIATFFPQDVALIAHSLKASNSDMTWINIGVTLWNLNNNYTRYILSQWKQKVLIRIQEGKPSKDQAALQHILQEDPELQNQEPPVLLAIKEEFAYGHGKFVRHFIRVVDKKSWGQNKLDQEIRLQKAVTSAREICQNYSHACIEIDG